MSPCQTVRNHEGSSKSSLVDVEDNGWGPHVGMHEITARAERSRCQRQGKAPNSDNGSCVVCGLRALVACDRCAVPRCGWSSRVRVFEPYQLRGTPLGLAPQTGRRRRLRLIGRDCEICNSSIALHTSTAVPRLRAKLDGCVRWWSFCRHVRRILPWHPSTCSCSTNAMNEDDDMSLCFLLLWK